MKQAMEYKEWNENNNKSMLEIRFSWKDVLKNSSKDAIESAGLLTLLS